MQTLRLTQTTLGRNHYQTEISLEGDGVTHQTAKSTFHFKITKDDQERIRWYFEDYLQYPLDPNPKIAKRIESRMAEIGIMLFKSIFQPDGDEHDLCATLRSDLNNTRIEIASGVQEAVSIPWELLLDPKNNTILALHALSFVRSYAPTVERSQLNGVNSGPIRILLVICRPAGKDDVPFRSVASRLIKGLGGNRRNLFQLDVLRPPTFEQLGKVLSQADSDNKPYHLVHFDGHGMYEEIPTIRKGRHGYLIFEDHDLVDGPTLGKLLMSTNVRVLILNACRSAHAEIQGNEEPIVEVNKRDLGDYNNLVYAYGSFAHEVMAAGVNGVVAMRYNVYVETAAQFVADLYASLCMGSSLGNAVSLGRKQLKKESLRTIAYTPISLHDWSVPVVYETTPISLFSKEIDKLDISLKNNNADSVFKNFSQNFPKRPDVGFFGRDETLLAIDRALDTGSIVLLHACLRG